MGLKEAWDTAGMFFPMPLVGKSAVKVLILSAPAGTATVAAVTHVADLLLAGLAAFTAAATTIAVVFIRHESRKVPLRMSKSGPATWVHPSPKPAAQPQVVHYHTHYEEHSHYHPNDQHVHVTQPQPAVETQERRAIAPRRVVPGVVEAVDGERIRR